MHSEFRRPMPIVAVVALGAVLATLPSVAAAQEASEPVSRRVYAIQFLGLEQARLIVEEEFPDILNTGNLKVEMSHLPRRPDETDSPRGFLQVVAPERIHDGIAEVLARYDLPPRTLLFQIHLLKASADDRGPVDLPSGAKQAVADLRQFLPFKGYELLESGIVRASGYSDLELSEEWEVRFRFRTDRRDDKPLIMEAFELERKLRDDDGPVERKIISTTFSTNIGETVVVGASKLDGGDEALVVLLTVNE